MKTLSKFGVELYKGQLTNGANVFLFKRNGMPIHIVATFLAGSRFDKKPGTSHFLEHMVLAGTKKFPSKNLIADHIYQTGGEFGASTNNNLLELKIEVPESQDLDTGLEVLSECITNSLFDEKTIETERGSILSELRSRKSNPKEHIWDVSRKLYLQETEAGVSILGTEESVKSILKNDLLEHKENFITGGRITYLVSGDVDFDTLVKKLENIKLPTSNKFEPKTSLPIIKEKLLEVEHYPGVNELQVHLSCRTSVEDYKEYCALKIANEILSSGRGSRLVTKLRYENGLIYSINGNVSNSIDWGVFSIKFSCVKDNFDTVKKLIFEEFTNLRENGVSKDDLEKTKIKISKGLIRQLQTSMSWVNFHRDDAIFFPDNFKTVEDYINTISKITLEDINFVVNKYLKEENFYTAICGDY